jgi:uncharacterized protein YneF (UPF0154 family)
MWIPVWVLWLAVGLFIGYWLGMFQAMRRLSKAKKEGKLTIRVSDRQ